MPARRRWLAAHGGWLAGMAWPGSWAAQNNAPNSLQSVPQNGASAEAACGPWPAWQAYASAFIQRDGRVIDDQHGTRYTTSEGQAYSLFFALVGNDRARFDTLLAWTQTHLAEGKLGERLPGWRWGRRDNGSWGMVDGNAASDADLWMAHTLFEASRLWRLPALYVLAGRLLSTIRSREVVNLEGFGPMLLPGPEGFVHKDNDTVRINPSYLVLPQLRAMAREDKAGPWHAMAQGLPRFFQAVCPRGLAPDWVRHRPGQGWLADATTPHVGSHDAIRCYLWAGLVHRDDPLRRPLLRALHGMQTLLEQGKGQTPMRVHAARGTPAEGSPPAPPGFAAALLPYARALGRKDTVQALSAHVRQARAGTHGPAGRVDDACQRAGGALLHTPPTYYDQVLALFGEGAVQGRFGFDVQGRLWTAWHR